MVDLGHHLGFHNHFFTLSILNRATFFTAWLFLARFNLHMCAYILILNFPTNYKLTFRLKGTTSVQLTTCYIYKDDAFDCHYTLTAYSHQVGCTAIVNFFTFCK